MNENLGLREEVPYGMRISSDCRFLEENPAEIRVVIAILEGLVQDMPLSQIALDLNARGFTTRDGSAWGPGAIFDLLPRLIDISRHVFSKPEWIARRKSLRPLVASLAR